MIWDKSNRRKVKNDKSSINTSLEGREYKLRFRYNWRSEKRYAN